MSGRSAGGAPSKGRRRACPRPASRSRSRIPDSPTRTRSAVGPGLAHRRASVSEATSTPRRVAPLEERMTTPASWVSECSLDVRVDCGRLTSMTVRPFFSAIATHFSSSKATRQTASPWVTSSRTRWPVLRSQTLTRPSLPPLTILVSSNCKLVTLLSWAARR